jgi:DNA helicase-2/ATP-dependent DNA helicase PcrA
MAWDDGLEGLAHDIAASDDPLLRVVAGPGTGKTFALKRRVARLLEIGVPPGQILLVTFTRMAARDTEREISELDIPGVDRIRKGTLHAFCFSTLNQANVLQITGRIPRPLLQYEERFMLEDLGSEQGNFHENYYNRRRRLKAFEAAWAREQDQQPGWLLEEADHHFQGILNEWLRFHRAMLIGELVPITLSYLRDNPGVPELGQYRHVLVDEYQDLNRAEQSLIDLLAENGNLTVVGDEDQSIYEAFRYAHPEGISQFDQQHQGTLDIPLEECRRCPTRVVNMANNLIQANLRRLQHRLSPRPGNSLGEIYVVQWQNMEEEAEGIANYIAHKIRSEEFDRGQTLVLSPRRQFGYMVRDRLVGLGVSAHSFFQEEILEGNPMRLAESQAQQAFTLLNLIVNPGDAVALRCWLGFGSQNLRVNEYERLRSYRANHRISFLETLNSLTAQEIRIPYTNGLVQRYRSLLQYQQNIIGLSVTDILADIFPVEQEWCDPLRAILGQLDPNDTLDDALNLLKENIIQPELPTDVDYVRIMSLHKSKGLNANHVIVIGCIEGIMPTAPSDDLTFDQQQRYVEEQRRLFYVAITRTRGTLVLSSALRLPRDLAYRMRVQIHGGDNQDAYTIASSFIAELGPECPRSITGGQFLSRL